MSDLSPGDRITLGITYEIKIDGEKAWPKAEINTAVQEGEDSAKAIARAQKILNDNYIKTVTAIGETIAAANKTQRG